MIRRFALFTGVLSLVLASACGREGVSSSAFPTRADAGEAVPAWVPSGATELRYQLQEGSGAFWLRFRLPAPDRSGLEAELLRIPDGQVATLTFRAPKGADWWFRGLVQVVPARETTVVAADVYSGAGRSVPPRTFVAFDRGSDTVYAWSSGR